MLVINRGAASRTAKTGLQTSWTAAAKYQKNGPKNHLLIWKRKDNAGYNTVLYIYGSVLSKTVDSKTCRPWSVMSCGIFCVILGTSKQLPNSIGLMLMRRNVSLSSCSTAGSSSGPMTTSLSVTWLKLNCLTSKLGFTFWKFWAGRLHPGLDFSGLYLL